MRLFQGGGGGGGGDEAPAPPPPPGAVLLTRQIMGSGDLAALQATLEDRLADLNAVHVSAALHQMSRIVGPRGAAALAPAERRRVVLLAQALVERAGEVAG